MAAFDGTKYTATITTSVQPDVQYTISQGLVDGHYAGAFAAAWPAMVRLPTASVTSPT